MEFMKSKEKQKYFCLAIYLSTLMLMSACTSTKTADPEAKVEGRLSVEEEKIMQELQTEIELGRNMAGRLLQFYGVVEDSKLQRYINTVGTYVGTFSEAPERRYMFAVLNDESVNAFACPGGYILVTLGALRLAQNEAELGMILGHEVAHVGKKHMFTTLQSMDEKEMEKNAEELSNKENLPESMMVRKRPKPEEGGSAFHDFLAKYVTGGAGAGLSVLKAARAGMNVILEKGLDHKFEFEADHEGVKYGIRAGYHPKAMNEFLDRMLKNTPEEKRKILAKTHPKIEDRIEKVNKLLKSMEAETIVGAKGTKRFAKYRETFKKIKTPQIKNK